MGVRLPPLARRILLEIHTLTTEDERAYNRAKYYEYRLRDMEYVAKGGPVECAQCGSIDSLEFDHIDPALKSFNINTRKSHRQKSYLEELDKCQLLCAPCHRAKTAVEHEGFEHGTVYGFMKKRCNCGKCEARKREWNDARNEARRGLSVPSSRRRYGLASDHGERITYTRGCRCDLCRAANTAYERERKARKALANP